MYMQLNILVAYDHVHETHYVDGDWPDFATIAKKSPPRVQDLPTQPGRRHARDVVPGRRHPAHRDHKSGCRRQISHSVPKGTQGIAPRASHAAREAVLIATPSLRSWLAAWLSPLQLELGLAK